MFSTISLNTTLLLVCMITVFATLVDGRWGSSSDDDDDDYDEGGSGRRQRLMVKSKQKGLKAGAKLAPLALKGAGKLTQKALPKMAEVVAGKLGSQNPKNAGRLAAKGMSSMGLGRAIDKGVAKAGGRVGSKLQRKSMKAKMKLEDYD